MAVSIQELIVNCATGQVTTQTNPDTRVAPVVVPPPDLTAIINAKLTEPGMYRLAQILGYVP